MSNIKLGIYNIGAAGVIAIIASIWAFIMVLAAIANIVIVLYHCSITLYHYISNRISPLRKTDATVVRRQK